MPHRHPFPVHLLAAALGLAFGCATERKPPPLVARAEILQTPAAPAGDANGDSAVEPAVDPEELYAELARQRLLYEAGVDWIVSGEELLGEEAVGTATRAMREAATTCAETPGCDLARFLEAFDDLLDRQWSVLKRQVVEASRIAAPIDVPPEEAEAGTPAIEESGDEGGVVETIPAIGETVSMLRGTDLRDLIELNGPVKAAIDDWLTWLRPQLMEAFENYQFLRDRMAPVYEEAGLPEALLFGMIATESGGKVHAHSRAGAAGPLQFIRSTGRRYGLGVVDGFDLRYDPEAATRANVAYLNDLFALLNNDLGKALAAYNGGEARIQRLDRRLGNRPLWDGEFYWSLPRETREYVPRILAAAWLFLHPSDYNLEFPRPDVRTTSLTVKEATSLSELTICLGQTGSPSGWFRILRNLNPKLEPGEEIPAGAEVAFPESLAEVYDDRCVGSQIAARARELREANYPEKPEMMTYVVQRGDTLGRIAARYRCVSTAQLAALNEIRPPRYTIRIGQRLKIPTCR